MSKKEELSEQYRRKAYEVSPTRKRCQYNNEVIAWNNEIVGAFESGWDAAIENQDKSFKWIKNSVNNKPQLRHSVLMKTTLGIAEGEWQGDYWLQYRWSCRVKDKNVLYWIELNLLDSDLPKEE